MNRKGLVFSLSMLFLILSFILLQQSALKTASIQQDTASAINSFQTLINQHNNLSENIIYLNNTSSFRQVQERSLPFSFDIDNNILSLGFKMPIKDAALGRFFDSINSFKIFVEDTNYSNFFTGIDTNVFTVQNTAWGGTFDSLNFVVEPSCMNFSTLKNSVVFSSAWCNNFDLNEVTRVDTNISINFSGEDLNSVECYWNGTSSCPNDSFNPVNGNPYFNLQILDINCTLCVLNTTQINGHFDITQDNWIAISCIGSECASKQIDLNLTESYLISRNEAAAQAVVSTNIQLKKRIRNFYFNDMNLSVSIPDFNLMVESPK